MFNETAYLGDAIPTWQQLGYPNKQAWKQAGSPSAPATSGGGGYVPVIEPPIVRTSPSAPSAPASTSPLWQQLGFGAKGEWKRAGRPNAAGQTTTPVGGNPLLLPAPDSGGNVPAGDPAASGGGLLSGIPSSYLLIGAVVIGLMVFKK